VANAMYQKGLQAFLEGKIDWINDTIKAVLVDSADYTLDITNHEFLSDVPAAARVATATLAGKTSTNGVADASDTTFTAVSGDPCELVLLYVDTGVAGTSRLIMAIDTAGGLPVTPSGANVTIEWGNTAVKIFKL
jgi:hypothetical protein